MSRVTRRNAWPMAVAADALSIVVFATIGRASHDESVSAQGVWHMAWPFLLGAALALAYTAYRGSRPTTLRSGVRVWLWTIVIGMAVRGSLGDGTAVAFVIVATVVLGAFLLGWRFVLGWQTWRSHWHTLRP